MILRSLRDNFSFGMRKHSFDSVLMSRYLFVLVLSILTTLLIRMMQRQTDMAVENERLRTENLQIRYNALSNQMNPHFFFNSLNSLQYLLMDNQLQKSITYIEELSKVFRYILQSSKKEVVPLQEEIDFLNSYRFLLNIRFEEKIRFEIEIDDLYLNYELPVLTIQPLVENAINHNSCSMSKPLIIRISVESNRLIVSNNIIPKLRDNKGAGIGLDNLNNRFMLLMNKPIEIAQNEDFFTVTMPLKISGLHSC
jgi:Putative regulator of cell autolysis